MFLWVIHSDAHISEEVSLPFATVKWIRRQFVLIFAIKKLIRTSTEKANLVHDRNRAEVKLSTANLINLPLIVDQYLWYHWSETNQNLKNTLLRRIKPTKSSSTADPTTFSIMPIVTAVCGNWLKYNTGLFWPIWFPE